MELILPAQRMALRAFINWVCCAIEEYRFSRVFSPPLQISKNAIAIRVYQGIRCHGSLGHSPCPHRITPGLCHYNLPPIPAGDCAIAIHPLLHAVLIGPMAFHAILITTGHYSGVALTLLCLLFPHWQSASIVCAIVALPALLFVVFVFPEVQCGWSLLTTNPVFISPNSEPQN
ncbi:hypothetical protein niasHS_016714 [Heterodera schachtii]